jgi:predicted Rossmann fold nucleotide-binding protein DprA/Smf involved in DNA uptake
MPRRSSFGAAYINRIVSGGQTGADMGALLAAREIGLTTGGVAPRGWLTEKGEQELLLRSFGLVECSDAGYSARTRANVALADGTLLVGDYKEGGSRLTLEVARELEKPWFYLNCSRPPETSHEPQRISEFRNWLERYGIQILNVAGNRESQNPGIAEFTRTFLIKALGA